MEISEEKNNFDHEFRENQRKERKHENNNNFLQNTHFEENSATLNEINQFLNEEDCSNCATESYTIVTIDDDEDMELETGNHIKENDHNNTPAEEINSFQCDYCYVKFHNRVDLLVHTQEEHLYIKPEMVHESNCPSTYMLSRTCFVPGCTSTSKKYPDKIFLCVPLMPEKREKWFKAVNRDGGLSSTRVFCCEDHFDLENDAKNWLRYKLMGPCVLHIKDHVVPHIFPDKPIEKSAEKRKGFAASEELPLKITEDTKAIVELIDEQSHSLPSSILSLQRLLNMPDDKLEIKIKIEDSDSLEDTDWCINDDDHRKETDLQNLNYNLNKSGHNLLENETKQHEQVIEIEDDCDLSKENDELNKKIFLEKEIDTVQCDLNKIIKENDQSVNLEKNFEVLVKVFQCSSCQTSFSKEADLLQHIRVLHGTTEQYKSALSEDSLKHVKELVKAKAKDHLTSGDLYDKFHINDPIYINCEADSPPENTMISKSRHTCTICQKDYSYKTWKSHMKEVHSDNYYTCKTCGATFKCKRYLTKHTLYAHENGVKSYEKKSGSACPECPKTFKNSDCLSHHINNCHGKKVECEICHSKLKSIAYLNTHMKRVHYNDGKKHRCKICNKLLKSPRQVKIHVKNLHPETLHPCPKCVRQFFYPSQLNNHLKICKAIKKDAVNTNEEGEIDDVVVID